MYDAINISKYILGKCTNEKAPLSNLKLQKILFFVQVMHYAEFKNDVINDDFEAWDYGPVIRDVYMEYRNHGYSDIIEPFLNSDPFRENGKTKSIVDYTVEIFNNSPAWRLVEITHKEGTPWAKTYIKNEKRIIPKKYIHQYAEELKSAAKQK